MTRKMSPEQAACASAALHDLLITTIETVDYVRENSLLDGEASSLAYLGLARIRGHASALLEVFDQVHERLAPGASIPDGDVLLNNVMEATPLTRFLIAGDAPDAGPDQPATRDQ